MGKTVLKILLILSIPAVCQACIVTFSSIYKVGTSINPILQVPKSRHREVKRLSSGGARIHSQAD